MGFSSDIQLDQTTRQLHISRRLSATPAQVWEALTVSEIMSEWYPTAVIIDPQPGGRVELTFPGGEPEIGVVTTAIAQHRLAFRGDEGLAVSFELNASDMGTQLDFTTDISDLQHAASLAAGYDLSIDQLVVRLNEGPGAVTRTEMPPPAELVQQYCEHYDLPSDV